MPPVVFIYIPPLVPLAVIEIFPVDVRLALVDCINVLSYIVRPQIPPVALMVIAALDLIPLAVPSILKVCCELVFKAVTETAP